MSYIFYFGKFNACAKTYLVSNCKKGCSKKLLNIDKAHNFVISPLKICPLPGKRGQYNFSRNCNSPDQDSQFKKSEKNLSSNFVDDEHP